MNPPKKASAPAPWTGWQFVLGTFAVAFAIFMNVVASSIANVAIPTLSGDLVRRARNCLDRRAVNLTLTEAGRNAASRIAEIVLAMLNRRLSGFALLEFAALCGLLGKLLDE
jgi:hypothetical protein